MKSYHLTTAGEAFALQLGEYPQPQPGPGQVRVRVRACSLNYRDLLVRQGRYGKRTEGLVPLSDGAGEVEAVGDGVQGVRPGDRVAGCFFQGWPSGPFTAAVMDTALGGARDGMLAEAVILEAEGVIPLPAHLSWAEAACLPCAGLTAWNALVTRGGLQPGTTVLLQGTGGVSIFALQFAVALGARVILLSSSDAKLERGRILGAAQTLNYHTHPDWEQEVWKLTEKRGVDHIVEVGGNLEKSLRCLAAGGHIAQVGVLGGGSGATNLFPLAMKNARLDGIYVGSRADFAAMNQLLNTHQLHPVIDRIFSFTQATEAYDHLASGSHFGKVVIEIP
ncbi:MAG: NAD(P)-dependent alcohol dehydrogenase [Candidatus Latescibacteria bacterium]|nr:NAD(P)-dependent alcohol dehydrogenase [Candidatus Latescibacterota bacterium]